MKLACLCDFPYWEGNVGTAVRYQSLCNALAKVTDLTMIATVTIHEGYRTFPDEIDYKLIDRPALKAIDDIHKLAPLPGVREDRQMILRAIKHILETGEFDAVLTPYFNRGWMIEHVDRKIVRLIDTHDCQSQRTQSFLRHGLLPTFTMTPDEEGAKLDLYDIILAMSDEDHGEFAQMTKRPIITAPFRLPNRPLYWANPQGNNLLFVAAKSPINDLTLVYLLDQVLPLVPRQVVLHVVGNVTVPTKVPSNVRIKRHENVDDVSYIYGRIDIALNPVYAGGGVKTKTLEALSFGVPILTSDEGARGMRHLIPDSLIANDKETFAWQIETLLANPDLRTELSREITARYAAEDTQSWASTLQKMLPLVALDNKGRLA